MGVGALNGVRSCKVADSRGVQDASYQVGGTPSLTSALRVFRVKELYSSCDGRGGTISIELFLYLFLFLFSMNSNSNSNFTSQVSAPFRDE